MKKVTWILIAVFAMACCGTIGNAGELESRAQVLMGENNQIDQNIAQGEKMKSDVATKAQADIDGINKQIVQLQIDKLKRLGALEELARLKEIADKEAELNAELAEMEKNRREAQEEVDKVNLVTETVLVEEIQD